MFDWLGVLFLLISGCGPQVDNPPPEESPAITAQTFSGGTAVWSDTAYTFTYVVNISNTGNVRLDSVAVIDSLVDADGLADDPVVTSGPTLINSHIALNGSWDGVAPNDTLFPSTGDSIPAGNNQGAIFTVRFNHNGGNGPYTNYVWVRGTSPLDSAVTATASVALNPPPATENPAIGIAKFFGAVSGSSGAYSVPCTLIVENLGDVDLDSVLVVDTLATFDAGTAVLDSVVSVTSALLTANTAFDGTTTHDSLTVVNATDTLFYGQTDTLAFVIHWDEGDSTSFDNQAWVFAQGPSSQDVQDKSDWGSNPDPSGDGDAGGANEGDVSTVTITPPSGESFDVVVDKAGTVISAVTFYEGQVDSSVVTSGAGFAAADSNAVEYDTYCEPLVYWPDGTIRIMRVAWDAPFAGTFDIVELASPQSTTPVDISSDPGFYVTLNGTNYTFTAADFTETTDSSNPVYREGYASAHDGGADYQGQQGGITVMWWRRWNSDGSTRNFVGIRNQRVAPDAILTASVYDGAIPAVWSLNQVAASDSFRIRWAADAGLGDGTNEASKVLWDASSYTYPDVNGDPGSNYEFGGQIRAGEELWAEVTEGTDPDPPVAFQTAARYSGTKGFPFTDDLQVFSAGTAWSAADSLLGYWESTVIDWVEGMDARTPHSDRWKNIRDVGVFYRKFDGQNEAWDHSTGGDQYEVNLGLFKNALAMARVSSDTLTAHADIQSETWDLFEGAAVQHEAPKYNLDYSGSRDLRFAYGMTWAHTEHGTPGAGDQGRSNQLHPNYYHGVALYPLYYMTGRPYLPEKMTRVENLMHYVAISNWGSANWPGEFRSGASGINWTSMIYDMKGGSENLSDLMSAIRLTFSTRDWGTPPSPSACGTSWNGDKPWQMVYAMIALRQAITVLYRWGDTTEAQEAEGYLAQAQQFADDYAIWQSTDTSYDGGGPRVFTAMYYSWGDGGSLCDPQCTADCMDFWLSTAAGAMVDYPSPTYTTASMMETGLLRRGSGTNFEGWDNFGVEMQKKGLPMQWGHVYFYNRSAPGKSQAQQSIDTIWD